MLVLVALFVQVNEGLPATAYIKMIDIWLIFNLVVPFILIVIHTYMDTLRPDEGTEYTPPSPEFKTESNAEATTEFTKQPTVRSPPRPPTSILYSLTPSTKVSVMTSRQKRNMRICFHLANIVLPIVFVSLSFSFLLPGLLVPACQIENSLLPKEKTTDILQSASP